MSHKEVLIIIDSSGSMEPLTDSTISNFNELLQELKTEDEKTRLTLITFDREHRYLFSSKPVSECDSITSKDYLPSGTTALYDAVGEGIERLHEHIEEHRENVIGVKAIIMTDGLENASRKFNKSDIQKKIAYVKEWYQWDFQFYGANIDEGKEAKEIGLSNDDAVHFDHSVEGITESFISMSKFIRED